MVIAFSKREHGRLVACRKKGNRTPELTVRGEFWMNGRN